jgi:UDP-glucose 4-epimerase
LNLNKKYIVTGGAGFIGSHLIEKLIERGNKVICVDDLSTGRLDNLPQNDNLIFIKKQAQNIIHSELGNDIDGIFHLAAQASVPVSINNFFDSSKNNLLGMLKIWEFAKKGKIPIVFASSSAVYGNLPIGNDELNKYDILSPYARDKLTMEDYAAMCFNIYNIPSVGLRFFNVYGPRQDPSNPYSGVISIFIDKLLQKKSVTVNGGYQTRDFIFVEDIVKVMIESMEYLFNNRSCDAFNVGTGVSITIDQLLVMLTDIIEVEPKINIKELPSGDPEKSGGTYEKLTRVFNIDIDQCIKLEDGLRATVDYIRNERRQ